ncbi:MAG: glycosyltransferase [Bacteroidota bacterium]|nr:glycosyltransferase [Bacteroidota bacterium]
MTEYKMTIIVPVFNELDNLDRLKATLLEYFSKSATKSQVLFIDDGSTDGSFNKILEICNANNDFKYIKFKKNCGLSSAIKAGIDAITTELTGYIDADLQTSPFDFENLLQDIDYYDAVIGYREKRKDTLSKKIQSLIANNIRRVLISDGIIDTGCPLKIIKTETAKKIPFFDGMHRFLPALIQLQGGQVKQISVQHFNRIAGKSKFNILNRSIKPLQDAFAYRWMRSRYINYTIDKTNLKI